MSEPVKIELTRGKIAALASGLVLLIALAVGATWALAHGHHDGEGSRHEAHEGHGDHDDHEGHEGHGEKGKGHGEGEKGHEEGKIKLTPAMIANAALEMKTAGPGEVAVTIALPGEVALNAEALAHVTPRIGGTVREVNKQLGDRVKKGDVLAVLDSRELAEMQRELFAAKERLTLAEASFVRQEALWREKISAEKDYLAAKQALAEAQIEHRSAAQKLNAGAGAKVAKGGGYALVAPLDGTIIEKHVSVGEVLKDDTQAFVIADLSTVWVNVTVYAKDLARIQVGQPVQVRAEGIERPAGGTITYLGQVVGEETRSANARVVLQNPGPSWRPGLFVTADVSVDRAAALVVVADDAVQTLEGKPVVFVEVEGAFEVRPVTIGRRGAGGDSKGTVVEVLKGVAAGDRYVARNSFILKAELGKSEAGHEH